VRVLELRVIDPEIGGQDPFVGRDHLRGVHEEAGPPVKNSDAVTDLHDQAHVVLDEEDRAGGFRFEVGDDLDE
jgi:hypothetical protein